MIMPKRLSWPEQTPGYFDPLHVMYIAGFSERLSNDLRHINIGVTFWKGRTLYNSFCKLKPPCSQDMRKNVVYCIGCKFCSQVYLGEIQQWFPSRRYQHEYAVKNQSSTNALPSNFQSLAMKLTGKFWNFLTQNRIGGRGKSNKHFS